MKNHASVRNNLHLDPVATSKPFKTLRHISNDDVRKNKATPPKFIVYSSADRNEQIVNPHPQITFSNSSQNDIPSQIVVTTPMDGVCRIVLSNPQQRNTLTSDVLMTLKEQLVSYSQNPDMRCIILAASGGVFSAGHNLKELTTSHGQEHHAEVMKLCTDVALAIRTLPVPVVAEVNGLATAAGCQLVASCDIVVASENALFSTPGANAGIFCSTPGVAVARALPLKVAAYMVFTGLPISAQEAVQYGLVSRVVSEGKLQAEALQIAMSIKSKSRSVIELGKKFFYKQIEQDVESAYRDAEKVMVKNLAMKDAQEGIAAFIEKRKPYWTHSTEEVNQ